MNIPIAKVLPNAKPTELALLCAAMVDPNRTMLEAGHLPTAAFYDSSHQVIWKAILGCYNAGTSIGIDTVLNAVAADHKSDAQSTLTELLTVNQGMASMAGDYAKILTEHWQRRRLIEAGHRMATQAFSDDVDAEQIGAEAMHFLTHMRIASKGPEHVSVFTEQAQERINKGMVEKNDITGIDTGLRQLNLYTHGLHAPDLWILAARPSLGKTSLATTIALNVAGQGKKVLMFSLEQSGCALTQRMIAGASRVNMRRLRGLDDGKVKDVCHAVQSIKKLPLWIDERGGLTVTQIRAEARRMAAVNGLDLVIVDYIGITRPNHRGQDRYEHLTEVSGELKNMAKELNVPVLALSQLSRLMAKEKRRPRPDDLRESGAIEQDADVIVLLSGDVEVSDLPEVWQSRVQKYELENVVLADVAKNREGATGWAFLQFNKEYTRYDDIQINQC